MQVDYLYTVVIMHMGSVLLGLFSVVRTTWLVPGNPFAPPGLNSNYDFIVQPDLLAIDPSHTAHLQGPPRAIYTFAPLGLQLPARTMHMGTF